jgi:hypothetical protein
MYVEKVGELFFSQNFLHYTLQASGSQTVRRDALWRRGITSMEATKNVK